MSQEQERKKSRMILMEEEVYELGRKMAKREGYSFSGYMRTLLIREVRAQEKKTGTQLLPPDDY
jgi:predicted CopG family antitoxin